MIALNDRAYVARGLKGQGIAKEFLSLLSSMDVHVFGSPHYFSRKRELCFTSTPFDFDEMNIYLEDVGIKIEEVI